MMKTICYGIRWLLVLACILVCQASTRYQAAAEESAGEEKLSQLEKGIQLYEACQFEEALLCLWEISSESQQYDQVLKTIGKCLFAQTKRADSLKAFDLAILLNDADAEMYVWRSMSHLDLGDIQKAKEDLEKAENLDSGVPEIFYLRIQFALIKLDDVQAGNLQKECLKHWLSEENGQKAERYAHTFKNSSLARIFFYVRHKQMGNAYIFLKETIEKFPNDGQLIFLRAAMETILGCDSSVVFSSLNELLKSKDSEEYIDVVSAFKFDLLVGRFQLLWAYKESMDRSTPDDLQMRLSGGNYTDFMRLFDSYIAHYPSESQGYFFRGMVKCLWNIPEDAEKDLAKFLELETSASAENRIHPLMREEYFEGFSPGILYFRDRMSDPTLCDRVIECIKPTAK